MSPRECGLHEDVHSSRAIILSPTRGSCPAVVLLVASSSRLHRAPARQMAAAVAVAATAVAVVVEAVVVVVVVGVVVVAVVA